MSGLQSLPPVGLIVIVSIVALFVLAVLLTAQLVPPVWVTLMVYCVALALFLLGQTLRVVQLRRDGQPVGWSVVLGVAVASVWLWQMLKVSHTI